MSMFVMKRDGKKESVHFDKITSRISKLCYGLDSKVCADVVVFEKALVECNVNCRFTSTK
jgi:hypothetical protein